VQMSTRTSGSALEPLGRFVEKRMQRQRDEAYLEMLMEKIDGERGEMKYVLCTFTNKEAADETVRRLNSYRVGSAVSMAAGEGGRPVIYRILISPSDRANIHPAIKEELDHLKPIRGWRL